MKRKIIIILFFLMNLQSIICWAETPKILNSLSYKQQIQLFNITPIPENIKKKMYQYSYNKNCPVDIDDLRYVEIVHYNYQGNFARGQIIVHKTLASEVSEIFQELLLHRFSIKSILPIDQFNGKDNLSMAQNNSSAFHCRKIKNYKNLYSKHSYGIAIDINPLVNPHVGKYTLSPKQGAKYKNRNLTAQGMIDRKSICYQAFKKRGWRWGGDWKYSKDYQHFEKTINF